VGDGEVLKQILTALQHAVDLAIVFPVDPRTRQRIQQYGIDVKGLLLKDPLGYLEFLALMGHGGHHGFGRHPGGNHLPQGSMPHPSGEYGASRHRDDGHQHSGR
jgi:hypothetical protein